MNTRSKSVHDSQPAVRAEVVIFTLREGSLHLLLVKHAGDAYEDKWSLPGGFVTPREDLEECARRALHDETGLSGVYLEQIYTFSSPHRYPHGRVISVAYYALIPPGRVGLHVAPNVDNVNWFAMDRLPPLAFDQNDIVAMAHRRLAAKLNYSTIAFQFLPAQFTLSELQTVYETILQEPLDKRNFRKSVLAQGWVQETGEKRRSGAHRPAMLYQVREPGKVEIIK